MATANTYKTFGDTYLFKMYSEYNNKLMQFIMTAEEIDTDSEAFADIIFDIKRQNIGVSIANVATSNNIKLMIGNTALPAQFKVFAAKDLKGPNKNITKVYIDCTYLIINEGGKYVCKNIDILIAHLISAMTSRIYQADYRLLQMNTDLLRYGAAAYSSLFTNIVDYVFKISINPELKYRCKYLAGRFFLEYVMGYESESTVGAICRKISGLSDREERLLDIGSTANTYKTLKDFIDTLNHILKINFSIDILVDKWMFIYGPSTVFGIEFFPSFAAMMTDTYCGCYLNNQKTIEKIAGQDMVGFTKTIFTIGGREKSLNGK